MDILNNDTYVELFIQKMFRRRRGDTEQTPQLVAVKVVKIGERNGRPQPDEREVETLSWLKDHPHESIVRTRGTRPYSSPLITGA